MNTFQISNSRRLFILACVLVLFASFHARAKEINDLIFIHHSCGENWLQSGLHDALLAKEYIDERNDITYGTVISPDKGRPASLGDVPGDNTNICHWILWFNDYLGQVKQFDCTDGYNRIILFKSCFPTSDIWDDGTEPGDPFSEDQTLANYRAVYRHPEGISRKYIRDKVEYLPLEDVFAKHPEILFIPITSPPLCYNATDDANAHRARLFNNWLKNDWLTSYNKAHPGLANVAVCDWFNFLANPDNALFGPNRLKAAYGGTGDDSHPNDAANAASTVAFATGKGNFIDAAWLAYSSATEVAETSDQSPSPSAFRLEQNYPNPFNSGTTIRFVIPKTGHVRLTVFDMQGHEIAVLVDETRIAGTHVIPFNTSNLSSGIYIYRLVSEGKVLSNNLLLIK